MSINIPKFPELTFDEEPHIYKLNGVEIPSVSRVLEPLSSAGYAGISEKVLEHAAERGSMIHEAIENFIKFHVEDLDPEYAGYFNGFRSWWDKVKPIPIASEYQVYHKILQYAGTIDLVAYIDGKLTIIDFKNTAVLMDMTCGVQLEAYNQALSSHGIKAEEKGILHLKKDGKYKYIPYTANDALRWRVFSSLKCVYDYKKSYE